MKQKIGNMNVLYPMPVTIIGATVNNKVNFINVAHVGIFNAVRNQLISIGLAKFHYTNAGIKENKTFSVNLLSQKDIIAVDYIGLVSGKKVDKSTVFEHYFGELKTAPIITQAPLSMECQLKDIYDTELHEVFIGEIVATYADDSVLNNGKIDIKKVDPLLFDMSSLKYYSLGDVVGDCWSIGKKYKA